ncbi:MAG: pro-sigmaK processing inhibitor BofA family protein [Methanosarcinales archaeon]|nr:pro-sigmaK processing inhibitor BofA family protein [Methanosarcinales archaeon]
MFELLLYLLLAIIIVIVLFKVLKLGSKVIINSIIGIILLFLTNTLFDLFGLELTVDINLLTVIICAIAGIPGVILIIVLAFLGIPYFAT